MHFLLLDPCIQGIYLYVALRNTTFSYIFWRKKAKENDKVKPLSSKVPFFYWLWILGFVALSPPPTTDPIIFHPELYLDQINLILSPYKRKGSPLYGRDEGRRAFTLKEFMSRQGRKERQARQGKKRLFPFLSIENDFFLQWPVLCNRRNADMFCDINGRCRLSTASSTIRWSMILRYQKQTPWVAPRFLSVIKTGWESCCLLTSAFMERNDSGFSMTWSLRKLCIRKDWMTDLGLMSAVKGEK